MITAEFVAMANTVKFRLRPSVSIVQTSDDGVIEFFQSNTRRIKRIRVSDSRWLSSLMAMGGSEENLCKPNKCEKYEAFLEYLYSNCFLQDCASIDYIDSHPFRRVIDFIADYFPTNEAIEKFIALQDKHVVIVGCGAIGSWVCHFLAQNGISKFTVCDPDIVKESNLNRSLFKDIDIGKRKTECISNVIRDINGRASVNCVSQLIVERSDFSSLLDDLDDDVSLVINCSDFPNVDHTSNIISYVSMQRDIPHIIAGGYNLHLSLIGPTIIPCVTPCFNCIRVGLEKESPTDFSKIRKLQRPKRNIGNLGPLASISASFVASEALRVLVGSERLTPVMMGRRGEFNFLTSELKFSEYQKLDDCDWCGSSTVI